MRNEPRPVGLSVCVAARRRLNLLDKRLCDCPNNKHLFSMHVVANRKALLLNLAKLFFAQATAVRVFLIAWQFDAARC